MKIGILTYHRPINDGSVLQAYCLQRLVQERFPTSTVEIVDYRPTRGEWTEHRKLISRAPPFLRWAVWSKMRSVRGFLKASCEVSPQSCTTDDLGRARDFVRKQGYDAIIVGSDTVWEARRSLFAPPFPNLYFLPGLHEVTKVGFAASSDPVLPSYREDASRAQQIRREVEAFDFISIRDEATHTYLTDLGVEPHRLHFMPDPTLLWDFATLSEPALGGERSTRPLAGISVSVGDDRVNSEVADQLHRSGYEVVQLANSAETSRKLGVSGLTVGQRLGLHGALDLLVTDRFHGSIFTLALSGAPVIFVETSAKWPEPNSKGRDLFRRLGFEAMVHRYDGGRLPPDLVEGCLRIWSALAPDVSGGLRSLRMEAEGTLDRMFASLGTPE
jgi:polysaccharide pyruvyl transferase WcaK-like protein